MNIKGDEVGIAKETGGNLADILAKLILIKDTDGIKKILDALPVGDNKIGKIEQYSEETMLYDFETDAEVSQWSPDGAVVTAVSRNTQYHAHGLSSMLMDFASADTEGYATGTPTSNWDFKKYYDNDGYLSISMQYDPPPPWISRYYDVKIELADSDGNYVRYHIPEGADGKCEFKQYFIQYALRLRKPDVISGVLNWEDIDSITIYGKTNRASNDLLVDYIFVHMDAFMQVRSEETKIFIEEQGYTLIYTDVANGTPAFDDATTVIDVSKATTIYIQADTTPAGGISSDMDFLVLSSPDGTNYDTIDQYYAKINLDDNEIKSIPITCGAKYIKIKARNNDAGNTPSDAEARVYVREGFTT